MVEPENNAELEIAEKYYRTGHEPAERAIKKFVKDCGLVVHGGKALNAHLPEWLDRETKDWDVFAKKDAGEYASELEKKLDKRYGGDYFLVEAGVHPGTYRVRNKVTGDVVADITLQKKEIDFKNIQGINYATLEYHEDKIKETLANPDVKYRHKRDAATLQRIKLFRATKGRRPKSKKRRSHKDNTTYLGGMR